MHNYSKAIILLLLSLNLSIFFDIPILRQVLGFLWLSFIPGYTLIRILNLNEFDNLEIIIFAAGLGLATTMLLGLFLNNVSLCLGFTRPLSTVPSVLTLTIFGLILIIVDFAIKRNRKEKISPILKNKLDYVPHLVISTAIPLLSITGVLYTNVFLLLIMIICVSLLILISALSKEIPSKIFPIVIASCSIALLLHTALISKHIMGVDIFLELYAFKQTEIRGAWLAPGNTLGYSLLDNLNSILSVTILPSLGTQVLGIEAEVFFKLFYPVIFSIVPLALFKIYQKQFSEKIAFLSTMLYISLPTVFYGIEPLALCRQIIGILFLVLSLMLMLNRKIKHLKKNFLLILIVGALITSYYSLSYLFLFYAILFYIAPYILSLLNLKSKSYSQTINLTTLLVIMTMTFAWYIHVSNSPFNNLLSSLNRIISTIAIDFGKPESRGFVGALSSLSPFKPTSLVGIIHKSLVYTQFLFIGVGILLVAIKPKMFNVSFEFRQLSLASAIILLLCILVPNLALTLNPTRFYAIAILFLAPLFTLGGLFLSNIMVDWASKVFTRIRKINKIKLGINVVTFVLVATFLFQVGFINYVTKDYPYSYALDLNRKEKSNDLSIKTMTHSLYFMDEEFYSSIWLAKTIGNQIKVYTDWNSRYSVLKSYALLTDDRIVEITNHTTLEPRSYVYFKYITTQLGLIPIPTGYLNFSEVVPNSLNFNKIYSNGISDIYFIP